ncbi:MAG: UDP-N-acetylmuramoyl-L-alanine--D-glutamate ligase [Clostridia bacterium]|nr:UDP-N-acetylmuramoyl-L-alanine--D-glutamate ligase [Clostridia bacterium]
MTDKIKAFESYVSGKAVSVIGIGISNYPLIQYLAKCGAKVSAHDKKTAEQLGSAADELKSLGVTLVLGETYMDDITGDIVFKTPGMRFDHPGLLAAKAKGAEVTSEMEVFFELCPAKILAVTGSDGKTTTTTLISEMLKAEGKTVHLGGNIGTPLLTSAGKIKESDFVVVELSSFQLHTMKKSPHIAVMTNLSPNHLDVHKDYREYIDAKKNIMLYQGEDDVLVANGGNEETAKIGAEAKGEWRCFSSKGDALIHLKDGVICYGDEEILPVSDIKIPGNHNVENYMAAIGAVKDFVSKESILTVAKNFGGVPHRIELVRTLDGVRYYNSSIDSSPNRTINTLKVFTEPVVLIAGGKDKGIPYDEVGEPIAEHAKALILVGATSQVIYNAVKAAMVKTGKNLPVYFETSYEAAVSRAKNCAVAGDVVLLSNASTSFDMFRNFEERGNLFKELVNQL